MYVQTIVCISFLSYQLACLRYHLNFIKRRLRNLAFRIRSTNLIEHEFGREREFNK